MYFYPIASHEARPWRQPLFDNLTISHTGPRMALSSKLPLPSNRSDANARQAPSDTHGVKI